MGRVSLEPDVTERLDAAVEANAELDGIALVDGIFGQVSDRCRFGDRVPAALADVLAVNVSAVPAAEVAHPDQRRVDVQQTVVA